MASPSRSGAIPAPTAVKDQAAQDCLVQIKAAVDRLVGHNPRTNTYALPANLNSVINGVADANAKQALQAIVAAIGVILERMQF